MIRLVVRDALSWALAQIPLPLLQTLRRADERSPIGGRYNPRRAVLRIQRYLPVDRSIDAFQFRTQPPLFFANDYSSFSRRLFWEGMSRDGGIEVWRNLCAHATGILEIGANVGYYTVLVASAAKTTPYIAVEPHPTSAVYLRRNLQLNNLHHVEVVQAAVVGKKTCASMQLIVPRDDPDNTPAGAYLAGGEGVTPRSNRDAVTVLTTEAASLIRASTDLIKLDVEGHEFDILDSLLPVLIERRPTLFVEVRRRTQLLRRLLHRLATEVGYSIHAVGKDVLHPLAAGEILDVVLQDVYRTRDVILKAERGTQLAPRRAMAG
jgi:FkbM family methyltransferase